MDFMAQPKPPMEMAQATKKMTEGHNRLKPSDLSSAAAHTASKAPEKINTNHAIALPPSSGAHGNRGEPAHNDGTLGGMKIAFLGTGRMGTELARHLLDHHELTVWNRTAERAQPLVDAGAALAESPIKKIAPAMLGLEPICLAA